MRKQTAIAFSLPAVLAIGVLTTGAASETAGVEQAALETIANVAPEVLGYTEQSIEEVSAAVPEISSEPIAVTAPDSPELTDVAPLEVTLPFADEADEAVLVDGQFAFDHDNGAVSVPVVKDDGSVQVTTVIDGPDAPATYSYAIGSDEAVVLTLQEETGMVRITDAAGSGIGWVGAAWAKDANGAEVPTWYEVDGSNLVQHIDLTADDVNFPVVADPYLGQNLFSSTGTRVNSYNQRYTDVWAKKSTFGHTIHVAPGGVHRFMTNGWGELLDRRPVVGTSLTFHHQYDCHAAGGLFNIAGPTWDLEGHRSTKAGWGQGVLAHRCNW